MTLQIMPMHSEEVRHLAEKIDLTPALRRELACLSLMLGERPEEVFAEALSELRTLRQIFCDEPSCQSFGTQMP